MVVPDSSYCDRGVRQFTFLEVDLVPIFKMLNRPEWSAMKRRTPLPWTTNLTHFLLEIGALVLLRTL